MKTNVVFAGFSVLTLLSMPAVSTADINDDDFEITVATSTIILRDIRWVRENAQPDSPLVVAADTVVQIKVDKTKVVLSPTVKRVRIAFGGTQNCGVLAAAALSGLDELELRLVVEPGAIKFKFSPTGDKFVSITDGVRSCLVARAP